MFGKSIKLFKLFGFEVKIDISWILIAVLIAWSLASGFFPYYFPGLGTRTYWYMGIGGAIGLFLSIILHELFHSLVARRFGLQMAGITLFIFGGVAEMEEEPDSPKTEFLMAIAGPMTSIVIGFIFLGIYKAGYSNWPVPVLGLLHYLGWINLVLAVFNLLPAFPLDGGRIFRSALWKYKDNIQWATRVATAVGRGFGLFLIIVGIVFIITGSFINGIWWILIGFFLRSASQMSYQRVLLTRALKGERAGRFMKTNPVTVKPSITVDNLVQNYIYKYHYGMFPVVEDGDKNLIGCINTNQIKEIQSKKWSRYRVSDLLKQCSPDNSVSPDTDAMEVFSIMNRTNNSRLMVLENNRIVGVITLKDMLEFLAVKLDLEGADFKSVGIG